MGATMGSFLSLKRTFFSVLKGSFFKPEKNLVVAVFQKKKILSYF